MATSQPGFGPLLREWRHARRLTQEALADRGEVSVRHLSFLETGRASASREMVLVLANALDLPLRDRNLLLGAAGFAPAYRESALDAEPMAYLNRAIEHILAQQEPYPAIVLDRHWNVQQMNRGGEWFFARYLLPLDPPEIARANIAHAIYHPDVLRHVILDWEALAATFADLLHQGAAAEPEGSELRALRDAVLAYPGVPQRFRRPRLEEHSSVALPIRVRGAGGEIASFFTTLTSLGTPLDITAENLRIESYFPLDAATEQLVRAGTDAGQN